MSGQAVIDLNAHDRPHALPAYGAGGFLRPKAMPPLPGGPRDWLNIFQREEKELPTVLVFQRTGPHPVEHSFLLLSIDLTSTGALAKAD